MIKNLTEAPNVVKYNSEKGISVYKYRKTSEGQQFVFYSLEICFLKVSSKIGLMRYHHALGLSETF